MQNVILNEVRGNVGFTIRTHIAFTPL